MIAILNEILKFLAENSTAILTLSIPTLPIVVKITISKSFRNLIAISTKNVFKALFKNTFLTHKLFQNVERYKNMAKRINFIDKKKTKLFHILLETKLNSAKTKIESFIETHKRLLNSNGRKMELRNELENLTIDIIEDYEKNIPENFFKFLENRREANFYYELAYIGMCQKNCSNFKKTGHRCKVSCVDTIGFKEYHQKNIAFVNRFIETVPECEGEPNSTVFGYFCNYIDNCLYAAVHDAKKVFDKQNGRYKID